MPESSGGPAAGAPDSSSWGTGHNTGRRWPKNDPDGSCGVMATRRSLVSGSGETGRPREVDAVRGYIDLRLHDRVALDEIELYAEVLSAVAASNRPLTDDEIDEVLGLLPIAGRLPVRPDQFRGAEAALPAVVLPAAGRLTVRQPS